MAISTNEDDKLNHDGHGQEENEFEEEEDEEDLAFNNGNNEDNWSDDEINLDLDYSELMILRQTTDSSMIMAQTSTPHDTDFNNNNTPKLGGLNDLQPLSRQSSTKSQTPSTQHWLCLQCNELNSLFIYL